MISLMALIGEGSRSRREEFGTTNGRELTRIGLGLGFVGRSGWKWYRRKRRGVRNLLPPVVGPCGL